MDIDHCFAILEISPDSTYEEAKASYKLLAQVWHPDKHHNNEKLYVKATSKFKEINSAWSDIEEHFRCSAENEAERRSREERERAQRAEQEKQRCEAERPSREEREKDQRFEEGKKSKKILVRVVVTLLGLYFAIAVFFVDNKQVAAPDLALISSINSDTKSLETVQQSGRLGLIELSGSFLFNTQEGNLFVIRGEAVNEFIGLRSSVLIRGTIYDDNGAVLQSQSAYAGNPLPDSSLKKLGFQEIRNLMNKELGENLANLNIAPGKGIPFAIVFNKVPKNIKEFSVEVLESKPGSK